MTPDANDICIFAVRRGDIERLRFDVSGTKNRINSYREYKYPVSKLSELVCIYSGGTPSKNCSEYWNGDIPWVSPKDFGRFYLIDSEDHITSQAVLDSASRIVPESTVLVVVRSSILKHTLPVAIAQKEVAINQDIKALITKEGIDAEYLGYFLKVFEAKILGICVKHSTTVQSINTFEFSNLDIPLPPLYTQKQLSRYMRGVLEKCNSAKEEANILLNSLSQIFMRRLGLSFDRRQTQITYGLRMLDYAGRLDADFYSPRFSHLRCQIEALPYDVVSIGDISISIITGFAAGKQDQADNLPEEQRVPQLRPFSVTTTGELSFETQKYVPVDRMKPEDYCQKGEVIFNNTNSPDLVGKTTVFDSEVRCAVSNHMTRITVKEGVNPYYVAAFFNVLLSIGYWKLLCTNFNNQAGVNTETLKNVKIPLPPKPIQDEIAFEIMHRRTEANKLRKEVEQEWKNAKEQFERELLGG